MFTSNRNSLSESTSLHNPVESTRSWKKRCCHSSSSDGFTVISSCFFVLTLAITCSLLIQIHYGGPEVTPHGAVASDDRVCSEIGIHTIQDGGSAVDATISSLLCLSVTQPHLVGPGGGGVMLVYDHKLNASKVFDFMVSYLPGSKIGVPGFLKGLEKVHYFYGKLPWKVLFNPAINLARNGFTVSKQLSEALTNPNAPLFTLNFKAEFFPKGIPVVEGQKLQRKHFAEFLDDVSVGGADELHLLKYGVEMVDALKAYESNVTIRDFLDYEVKEREVIRKRFYNNTIFTVGPPFGGVPVIVGLDLMEQLEVTPQTHLNTLYDAVIRGLSLGSSLTSSKFDAEFETSNASSSVLFNMTSLTINDLALNLDFHRSISDPPASQISSVDTYDLYVAAIVGLGGNFGSGYMTEHGIILNKDNGPEELEASLLGRHHASFTPLIIADTNNICGERIVLSSGSWSAMLQTSTQLLFRDQDMTSAIAKPRIALGQDSKVILLNDFDPEVEKLSSGVREYLKQQGFKLLGLYAPFVVNGVSKKKDSLLSHSDTRGQGVAARLHRNKNSKTAQPGSS